MKIFGRLIKHALLSAALMLTAAVPASAEVNDSDLGIHLQGALGGGRVYLGYVSYSNSTGDLGAGPGATLNVAAMLAYKFIGVEGNMLVGTIGDLEWKDEDAGGVEHTYESTGSGYYSILDLKLGFNLFREEGDMGYTFIYAGPRLWKMERDQDSFKIDDVEALTQNKLEADGTGWIVGFRDFSTIGPNDGFAVVLQTGFFAGKAPVDDFKWENASQDLKTDQSITLGGELAAGIALQNIGFSLVGGFRGEANVTTFKDPLAPADEESAFGLGNITFFVEAGMQF